MNTIEQFKETFKGITNFFNKKGEMVDGDSYPLDTKIARISIRADHYEVVLDV